MFPPWAATLKETEMSESGRARKRRWQDTRKLTYIVLGFFMSLTKVTIQFERSRLQRLRTGDKGQGQGDKGHCNSGPG